MFQLRKLDIDSYHGQMALLHEKDAKHLGLSAGERISVFLTNNKQKRVICELDVFDGDRRSDIRLQKGELGLFEGAFAKLDAKPNQRVSILPAPKPNSLESVKEKFKGKRLSEEELAEIIRDIVSNSYSEVETTYFVLACTSHPLDDAETIGLTKAMVNVGHQLDFRDAEHRMILDKHCIGGVPGNRTTMVVVPIIAAAGLRIPKSSSRSITSPSGTADTMEALANVGLSLDEMYRIITKVNGCIIWGGALDLSPADDIIINVEHPLELDSEGQMIASILSKKKSVGSTHVLLDIPVGDTAKVTSSSHARRLKRRLEKVGKALGMQVEVVLTDGSEPIGRGIGPALEAEDVMRVLRGSYDQPQRLRTKAIEMAGILLEMGGAAKKGKGEEVAENLLRSGRALAKFEEIIAQQGEQDPSKSASEVKAVAAKKSGTINAIHNKHLSHLAFVLGAPNDKAAGLYLYKRVGEKVNEGDILFEMHTNSSLKLKYGQAYAEEKMIYDIT